MGANGTMAKAEAYAERIVSLLQKISDAVRTDDTIEQTIYVRDSEPESGGQARLRFRVPMGSIWVIERAVYSGTPTTGAVDVYLDDEEIPMNRIDSGVPAGITGAYVSNGIDLYIPSGRSIVVVFALQAGSQLCSVNFRVREIKTNKVTP